MSPEVRVAYDFAHLASYRIANDVAGISAAIRAVSPGRLYLC